MLNDHISTGQIYLAMGHSDLRRGIDGLAVIVQDHYGKEIREKGSFRWPRRRSDLAEISSEQYKNLMRGLEIELNKIPREKLAPRII